MSTRAWILGGLVLALLVGGFYWYGQRQRAEVPPSAVLAPPDPAPPSVASRGDAERPSVAHPLPAAAQDDTERLPPLSASDSHVRETLEEALGKAPLEGVLIPDQLLRRFVVTVNSLDGDPVALRQRPLRHVPGQLQVNVDGERLLLSPDNAQRYTPLVKLLQSADPQRMAGLYLRYYPLLQKAYAELGYPDKYFNDRVIEVLDHLLESREVAGPVELVRPKVLYEFADRNLEKRSSGEKILIRMGPDHAATVRNWLRAFRDALLARTVKPADAR